MFGFKQLKGLITKNKWKLLIIVWSIAFISLYSRYTGKFTVNTETLDDKFTVNTETLDDKLTVETETLDDIKRFDVLLNSYMRSGSSLTGKILGWREDSLYVYEPLRKLSKWTYWHGNDRICRLDRLECRDVDPGKNKIDRRFYSNAKGMPGVSLENALKYLTQFYDCQFNDFEQTVFEQNSTLISGGPNWKPTADCIQQKGDVKLCIHQTVPRVCKYAAHKVAKVLRLSTDLTSGILKARKNMKVIHLFRDPRAIINSRIETKWYPTDTDEAIIENAKSLCTKMLYDFREGKKLLKFYPNRFMFVYYEDLTNNPLVKSKKLFRYLGMDSNEKKYPKVRALDIFDNKIQSERRRNTAFWWRMSLKWEIVQKMETACSDVYKELGYLSMKKFQDYKNLSVPSVDIPKEFLI